MLTEPKQLFPGSNRFSAYKQWVLSWAAELYSLTIYKWAGLTELGLQVVWAERTWAKDWHSVFQKKQTEEEKPVDKVLFSPIYVKLNYYKFISFCFYQWSVLIFSSISWFCGGASGSIWQYTTRNISSLMRYYWELTTLIHRLYIWSVIVVKL